jgi:hypothetical protein
MQYSRRQERLLRNVLLSIPPRIIENRSQVEEGTDATKAAPTHQWAGIENDLDVPLRDENPLADSTQATTEEDESGRGITVLSYNMNVLLMGATSVGCSPSNTPQTDTSRVPSLLTPDLRLVATLTPCLYICRYLPHITAGQGTDADRRIELFLQELAKRRDKGRLPDVLALQEFFSTPWLFGLCRRKAFSHRVQALGYGEPVVSRPGLRRYLGIGRRTDGSIKLTDSGLMVFSRLRVVAQADHYFSSSTSHDRFAMKGALWVR